MKTISAKRLEQAGACADQARLFRETFGDEPVRLTPENWERAGDVGLNRLWMDRFLKGSARAEYEKVFAAAQAEYEKVRDAAWAEYEKVFDAAQAEYEKVRDAAWAEYEKVFAAARAEYVKVFAAALFAALTCGEGQYED